jgi:hypothetical protein
VRRSFITRFGPRSCRLWGGAFKVTARIVADRLACIAFRLTKQDAMPAAGSQRQQQAIAAARTIAARYGVLSDRPTILHDSNHTVIHLAPEPLVAKVGTSPSGKSLAYEVAVAQYLAAVNAPIVPPTSMFPLGPHVEGGMQVTFWEYCAHDGLEPSPDVLGQSLRLLHEALAGYPHRLRAWDRFDDVQRILDDSSKLTALSADDRTFLRSTFPELLAAVNSFRLASRPLHGEPHSANLLLSPDGPRWIDFEAVCFGPQEWDLTVLPDEVVARSFDEVDWDVLRVLRRLRSLCVAVWCWLDPDRDPILRQAGTYHLALLRG